MLRRSSYIHQITVDPKGGILIIHAIEAMRLPADRYVNILLDYFSVPHAFADACEALTVSLPFSKKEIGAAIDGLVRRGILTQQTAEEEQTSIISKLAATYGRDPTKKYAENIIDGKRSRSVNFSSDTRLKPASLQEFMRRIDILLCTDEEFRVDVNFLKKDAHRRHIDLHCNVMRPDQLDDHDLAKYNAILISSMSWRHTIVSTLSSDQDPHNFFVAHLQNLVKQLRKKTSTPILIDNLPEPTVQPLGLAESGPEGHRNRFRRANIALAELAATIPNVFIVDIAATLAHYGSASLLDDGLVDFTRFGSLGEIVLHKDAPPSPIHNPFQDKVTFSSSLKGSPFDRAIYLAKARIDMLVALLAISHKTCVIVSLDYTLWPGRLVDTGSPFAWTPEISGAFSYVGLYFGLHEALLCLKKRGITLVGVSKNDPSVFHKLWYYPDTYPKSRLLMPHDFSVLRINNDNLENNIQSITDELGLSTCDVLFIDREARHRNTIEAKFPDIEIWGENPFDLRGCLLNDPRLQARLGAT